jgi:hypothetical protein
MNKLGLGIVAGVMLAACGDKAKEAGNAVTALGQAANAATSIQQSQEEAERFYQERREKGDTLAVPYSELQEVLPASPNGYAPSGEPSGSSQSMGGFSMSQVEQTYSAPAGAAEASAPSINITIVDFGGTQAGYGMLAAPMMMAYSQEDAHSRTRTIKMDVPYTWGSEEYNKDSKTAKVTALTRYRYVITVEARNQADDQTAMAKSLAEAIAKTFEGK